jgi:hypothetical protein
MSTTTTDIEIVLGLIISASALYSYFHKTPFPLDFNLILGCMAVYYIATGLSWLVKKFYAKDYFIVYNTSFEKEDKQSAGGPNMNDDTQKLIESIRPTLKDATVKVSSRVDLYSDQYNLRLEIVTAGGKTIVVGEVVTAGRGSRELWQVHRR